MKRIVCSYLFKRTSESTHPKQIPFYHLTRCPNYKNKKRSWMPISPSPLREWLLSLSPGLHSHCPCFFPGVPYLSPCYQSCSVPTWPPYRCDNYFSLRFWSCHSLLFKLWWLLLASLKSMSIQWLFTLCL